MTTTPKSPHVSYSMISSSMETGHGNKVLLFIILLLHNEGHTRQLDKEEYYAHLAFQIIVILYAYYMPTANSNGVVQT